ncbi:Sec-independent protein translocase subunit TatA/TatB [Nannocystaceae bacterium ST9]
MFGLGMMEIGLIIALAVMLFPPTELPKLARSIARVYGQVRKTADDFRNAVLNDEDLRNPIDEIKGVYEEARGEVRDAERKARQQLAKAQMDLRMATARRLQSEREAKAAEEAKAKALGNDAPTSEPKPTSTGDEPQGVVAAFPGLSAQPDDEGEGEGPVASPDPRTLSRPRAVAANGPAEPTDD